MFKKLLLGLLIILSCSNATLQKFTDGESWYSATRNDGISITRNRVGVLTTTPSYTMDVRGTVNATNYLGIFNGTVPNMVTANINNIAADEILVWNGSQWVNAVNSPGAGIGGTTFFLDDSLADTANYFSLLPAVTTTSEILDVVTVNSTTTRAIESYITTANGIGLSGIPSGVWEFNTFCYADSTLGETYINIYVYKRDTSGVETLLFSVTTNVIDNTSVAINSVTVVQPAFIVASTDRLVAKYVAKTTSVPVRTVTLVHNGTQHYSHFHTPIQVRHNDLAGLQGGAGSQYYHLSSTDYSGRVTNNYYGSVTVNGNLHADTFSGDGSHLMNIVADTVSGDVTLQSVTINNTLYASGNAVFIGMVTFNNTVVITGNFPTMPLSYMRRSGGIMTGSVNTFVVIYSTANESIGSDITYIHSTVSGDRFLINSDGVYSISSSFVNGSSTNGFMQIRVSKNINNLFSDGDSRTTITNASGYGLTSTWSGYIEKNNYVWVAGSNIDKTGVAPYLHQISITRIR